jgi:hypothetical protein
MKKVTKYQSRDGKSFDSPDECQAHENELIDQRRSAVYDIAVELYEEMLLEQKPSVLSCLNNLVVNLLKTKL